MAIRKCTYCKEYFKADDMFLIGVSSFCTQEHMWANESKQPNKKVKPVDVAAETRQEVYRLDGHRCRFCGKKSDDLIIHHIVYRSEAAADMVHSEDNLITLCNYPCHLFHVHGDKAKYQKLCQEIVKLRKKGDRTTLIGDLDGNN